MKPEPVPKNVVCSACGLPWDKHGEKPTVEKCVELLKAELAHRPMTLYTNQFGPGVVFGQSATTS